MITFTPNWKIVQKLMLRSFWIKVTFTVLPLEFFLSNVGRFRKIPLIFWGEKSSDN